MAQLNALPRELLAIIYSAAPTIQTAAHFSCVSRTLHEVWIENNDRIIVAILKPNISAYDLAVALALNEANSPLFTSGGSVLENARPPPNLWLPRLLRNAELCSRACAAMNSFLESLPESNYRRSLAFTSLPESYYMTRQLVLAYHNPPLQSTLRSKLEAAPKATLRTHHEMSLFMCEYLDDEEQSLQGIAKDKEDQTIDDELYANAVKEEWQFALDVTSQALEQRLAKPSSHVV